MTASPNIRSGSRSSGFSRELAASSARFEIGSDCFADSFNVSNLGFGMKELATEVASTKSGAVLDD